MHRATVLAFLLGFFTTAVSQSPTSSTPAGQSAPWTIGRCVNTFNPARAESTKAGYQYWFADKAFLDGRTLKLSVVRAGTATHAPHTHGEDEFFFVLEGNAEFVMNGDSVRVGPMTSLYCPPGSFHGIRNVGNADLKYLVIKKYELVSPTDQKKP
jgi:mannose-6-phosphate isomerase-like protein (cupin superfamily)